MYGRTIFNISILCLFLFLVSCSDNSEKVVKIEGNQANNKNEEVINEKSTPDEPVTITVALPWGEENFNARFGLVDEMLDHVNLEWVLWDMTWNGLEELFASQIYPDILVTENLETIDILAEEDMIQYLDEMIEKSDLSIDDLNPSLVSYIRSFDPERRMVGIPDGAGFVGLFYNKEIFDLFGYDYPSGVVTWDEIFDLAAKMTQERNDQQYIGLFLNDLLARVPMRQWAIGPIDPEMDEVRLTTEPAFRKSYELLEKYYNIPGLKESGAFDGGDPFVQGFAAMTVSHLIYLSGDWGDLEEMKQESIEIAPIPIWTDGPDTHPPLDPLPMIISKESEHIDLAFEVLLGYVSEENQLNLSRSGGSGSVLMSEDVLSQYGADLPGYQGKNVGAFYELPAGELKEQSKWDHLVDYKIGEFRETDDDANTFLRKLQDEIEARIEEEKEKLN